MSPGTRPWSPALASTPEYQNRATRQVRAQRRHSARAAGSRALPPPEPDMPALPNRDDDENEEDDRILQQRAQIGSDHGFEHPKRKPARDRSQRGHAGNRGRDEPAQRHPQARLEIDRDQRNEKDGRNSGEGAAEAIGEQPSATDVDPEQLGRLGVF